ncbi:MAG TPA: HDOD domain-containing protein [Terriglobia bacterium]|jgi:EAL and modified HD-GYP domain-containing signal transduction protein|nr:HDOD domain-containing protein [Terriglobia bacterium]
MSSDRFVARQPIFDPHLKVFGYELLFRSSPENFCPAGDWDKASGSVIDSFLLGLNVLTEGGRAFINFTHNALLDGFASMLPKENVVVEVLESVKPDPEILAACTKLKGLGYTIALDDVTSLEERGPLLKLADFVKVDFAAITWREKGQIAKQLRGTGIQALAEKVETAEDFQQAKDLGYGLFQGYFFRKPQVFSARDIPAFRPNYLRILQAVHRPELNFAELEGILKREVSLSYRLLRYLNSPCCGLRHEITSLRHALSMLGENEIRRWVSLVVVAGIGTEKQAEIISMSIIRARFCELIAERLARQAGPTDCFLMGLLSLLDAILARPMSAILSELSISSKVKTALLGGENLHANVYQSVVAYEKGDWKLLGEVSRRMKVSEAAFPDLYLEAVRWAGEIVPITTRGTAPRIS